MAYKRGDRWVGFYRDAAGRQHTNGNFRRKRDADRWEQEQKAAIRNDTWVDPGRSRMTVGEWSETWMAGRVHLKPKTLSSYRSLLTTRVLPTWDKVALTRIRHSDVVAWVAAMRAELSASRTRQAYHLLSAMLDDAGKANRLTRNPAAGVGLPRLPRSERRYLTHQQLADLADGCGPHRLMVLVAGYTGLRWGELTGLRARRVGPLRGASRSWRRSPRSTGRWCSARRRPISTGRWWCPASSGRTSAGSSPGRRRPTWSSAPGPARRCGCRTSAATGSTERPMPSASPVSP